MSSELFDLVDDHDNVIGTTDKQTAHEQSQRHRVAAVYVFNQAGNLLLQEHIKSDNRYDNSVGGHVLQGETYEQAAKREAFEELGLAADLRHVATFNSYDSRSHRFGLFECTVPTGWKFKPNDEVQVLVEMSIDDIAKLVKNEPGRFTSGFRATFEEYLKYRSHE